MFLHNNSGQLEWGEGRGGNKVKGGVTLVKWVTDERRRSRKDIFISGDWTLSWEIQRRDISKGAE